MELDGLTPEENAVFEWQYGYCGDFRKALWKAIMLADEFNLARLAKGFPTFVEGYIKYTRESGWWQEVQQKAIKLGRLNYDT